MRLCMTQISGSRTTVSVFYAEAANHGWGEHRHIRGLYLDGSTRYLKLSGRWEINPPQRQAKIWILQPIRAAIDRLGNQNRWYVMLKCISPLFWIFIPRARYVWPVNNKETLDVTSRQVHLSYAKKRNVSIPPRLSALPFTDVIANPSELCVWVRR